MSADNRSISTLYQLNSFGNEALQNGLGPQTHTGLGGGLVMGLRFVSHDEGPLPDTLASFSDSSYNFTGRSLSSNSTMLNTPSDNIRSVQMQRQYERARSGVSNVPSTPKPRQSHSFTKNGRFLKSKLLNLLQSLRRIVRRDAARSLTHSTLSASKSNSKNPLDSRKLQTHSGSEYSHFTYSVDSFRYEIPIRNSQIRSWESAEKITSSIVFDRSRDSDSDLDSEMSLGNLESKSYALNIKCLPGYTRGEVKVILEVYLEGNAQNLSPAEFEAHMKRQRDSLLFEYREKVQAAQERAFAQTHSFATRRQIQVAQKKDAIGRIFGYSNQLNTEYLTNNSCYLSLDNSSNMQKAFHEDKAEITSLISEETAFHESLAEISERLLSTKNSTTPQIHCPINVQVWESLDLGQATVSRLAGARLGLLYNKTCPSLLSNMNNADPKYDAVTDNELQYLTLSHFRLLIKEEAELDVGPSSLGD